MHLSWLSLSTFPHGMGWASFRQESNKAVQNKTQGSFPVPVGVSRLSVSISLACSIADADEEHEVPDVLLHLSACSFCLTVLSLIFYILFPRIGGKQRPL